MKRYKTTQLPVLFLCFLRCISYLFILLVSCPIVGQEKQKKELTVADYKLWSSLNPQKISDKGNWISYALRYESVTDTLFLKNATSKATFKFPQAYNESFYEEQWFTCQTKDNKLQLQNLSTNAIEEIPNVKRYAFTKNGKYLILFITAADTNSKLVVRNLKNKKIQTIDNVSKWLMNPNGNALVYFTTSKNAKSVSLLFLQNDLETISLIKTPDYNFNNPVWQEEGKAIAFLKQPLRKSKNDVQLKNQLVLYKLADKKGYTLDPATHKNMPLTMNIVVSSWNGITISKDCKRVIFGIQKEVSYAPFDRQAVQIWKADDKSPYPEREIIGPRDLLPHTYVWWPETDRIEQLSDDTFTEVMLNGNQTHAVTSDFLAYEPQFKMNSDRDYYITAMATGHKKLLLQKHSGLSNNILVSPGGKYISYFKDKNWWVYDILNDTHKKVTASIKAPLDNVYHDRGEDAFAYGNPGWSTNDKTLFIYDSHDIWEITPDDAKAKRLTNGRENHIVFRISEQQELQKRKQNYSGFTNGTIDMSAPLLLEAIADDFSQSGYYLWQNSKGLCPLVFEKSEISNLLKAAKAPVYLFMQQKFDLSPELMLKNGNEGKSTLFFKSNPHQKKYYWGTARLIDYTNASGTRLKGILHYPANYQPEKKYPMIVHIYERLTKYLYDYTNPSEYSRDGFNVTNLTSQGYFVLSPDISYTLGNPGISATDCVTAATKAALAIASINPKKIGLIGHSFGGYETNFIITQTNIFAAAVAGAAWTDLTSAYLYPGLNIGKPDPWRFEYHQLRMKKSLFEDPDSYNRNSPVLHATNIITPLLGWNGAKDIQVPYYQSTELYVALRRLQKRHILLVYPEEAHDLDNPMNQKDLTHRIEDWFAYYLKNEKLAAWMLPDGQQELEFNQLSKK
ncbi:prolyl oligopeptidase family serine peptidase [Flavobacterium galactosidilyticum]|uniref:alpha/beta hydrolase family protein n=1 Tax=Flavobacterium galactosidilyticum TaxID=2893886 RepID=UPI001E39313D|nr:prolyl oligopeptidase family serine peptidase [Flavobacterium sp. F-340]UFH46654.1 prolyl oligopeptidase family serine peptidase [Flavobacterium sp. F-340]